MLLVAYLNEHLGAGAAGRAFVVIAFVMACLAAYAAYRGERAGETLSGASRPWTRLAGVSFGVMGLGIGSTIALLLSMMTQHWYEYQYVQQHVNDELPFRYVFTAFWEGQEGSFLLWLFWHAVLGAVVWWRSPGWRLPVVAVIAAVQVVLLSMLLGVYLPFGDDMRLGSSPFLLLRETIQAPIFQQADYVSLIDGTGLNPLLQNYWMLIHPPTLFLGFASTVVPFAFACAGLWRGEHRAWLTPALRWGLFSAGILGIGILMGAAWAYEALNFGGYWAWDPVENTSLVPWLLMVAGIHTTLVARSTGYSIRSSYVFYILAFVGILYSSLLTRSGLLGETSVHAFTEMGLEAQLVFLTAVFGLVAMGLLAWRWRSIPRRPAEERVDSREFWMFLGSLVLLFSAGMITASTSLPVVNKLGDALGLGLGHLTINEPVAHYNKYQLWVGVFMATFTGIAIYLRWRGGRAIVRGQLVRLVGAAAASVVLGWLTASQLADAGWHFVVLAAGAWFALLANLDYLVTARVGLWQRVGSGAAHLGFAVMLLGILFSGLNQRHISSNEFAMEGLLDETQIGKNVILVKGLPMTINGYEVTYLNDTLVGNRRDYAIRYREMSREGTFGQEFVLKPYALYTNDFAKIASTNPDTKHYWDHDVFTHITGMPPGSQSADEARVFEDSLRFARITLSLGDTAQASRHAVELLAITEAPVHPEYEPAEGDIALGVEVRVGRLDFDTAQVATAAVVLRENLIYSYPAQINAFSVRVRVPEEALAARLAAEDELAYETVDMRPGDSLAFAGQTLHFDGFDPGATHPAYRRVEGDVAVGGRLIFGAPGGEVAELTPLFVIRDNRPLQIRDVDVVSGLHARLVGIDPNAGSATFALARAGASTAVTLPLEIAENASRNDWVVLEATVFPGINLFWAGSVSMLLGLLISMGFRLRERLTARAIRPATGQRPEPVAADIEADAFA